MAYSPEALAFSTIPANEQIRAEDRVSYLYLEHAVLRQDRTGVIALLAEEEMTARVQIPVAGIAVLLLGPGTSISHEAMASCARSGATVIFTGGGGVNAYATATSLTTSARWAIAQARLVSNEARQREAALILYKKQLGIEKMPGGTIAAMRGLEGQTIRNLYRDEAKKAKIKFHRDTAATDPVNVGLNIANSILYGCAASACSVLGINPALGIIHRGDGRSLLFDLADMYKPSISIPLVFSASHDADPVTSIRKKLRSEVHRHKVIVDMVATLQEILTPHLPSRTDDRLIGGNNREVAGHTQYGGRD